MAEQKHIGFVLPIEMAVRLEEKATGNERSVSGELRAMLRTHLSESATPTKGDALKDTAMTEPVSDPV